MLNPLTFSLIGDFKIPTKWQNALKLLPQGTVLSEAQFNNLLNNYLPKLGNWATGNWALNKLPGLGKQQLLLSIISKQIAQSYKLRRCYDAPQFKLITVERALCWVHEGRHYKKLSPVFACHQVILGQFIEDFCDYYRELLAYKEADIPEAAQHLKAKVWLLFETTSGYELLDERKQLTAAKVSELRASFGAS
ncbi:hypothetical protein QUA82_12185 [Microcoleus sp. F8-D3]